MSTNEQERNTMNAEGGQAAGRAAEERYRRILLLLPRPYREQRGEEILSTMLDDALRAERTRPGAGEALSVLGLSLRLRTGAPGASVHAKSLGEALRLITLLGLIVQAGFYAFGMAGYVAISKDMDRGLIPVVNGVGLGLFLIAVCGFVSPYLAMTALLSGRRRLGVVLSLNLVIFVMELPQLSSPAIARASMWGQTVASLGVCVLPTLTGALGFHRDAPHLRRTRPWCTAIVLAGGAFFLVDLAAYNPANRPENIVSNLFAVGVVLLIAGTAFARARRSIIWPTALMVSGAPLLFMLPFSAKILSFGAGAPFLTKASAIGMYPYTGLYVVGAEVLLAVISAAALLRRLRTESGTPVANNAHGQNV